MSLHSGCFNRSAAMQQEEVMLSSDTISRQLGFVCMFLALLHVLVFTGHTTYDSRCVGLQGSIQLSKASYQLVPLLRWKRNAHFPWLLFTILLIKFPDVHHRLSFENTDACFPPACQMMLEQTNFVASTVELASRTSNSLASLGRLRPHQQMQVHSS